MKLGIAIQRELQYDGLALGRALGMTIQSNHYDKLEAAINEVLAAHPGIVEQYRDAGLSSMRLNWDLLRACRIDGVSGITWICDNLYSYMNDNHINTALKSIVGNDGKSSKQANLALA